MTKASKLESLTMQLTYAYSIFIYEPGSINSLVLGDGRPPTFNDGNPYNGYDHPLLYGNIGSLDPSMTLAHII